MTFCAPRRSRYYEISLYSAVYYLKMHQFENLVYSFFIFQSLSNLPAADRVSVSSKQKKSPYYNTPDNTPPSKLVKNPVLKQGYDTLDSAYSTSESSYNTVDSSYLQQSVSSGYSTLESKWKEPKLSHPPGDKSSLASSVLLKPAVGYQQDIRFVDEIESSDTATETETDTEGTIGANTLDMSYVPDYIRPVTSALNSHSEDLLTITLSSSSKSIPTASVSTLKGKQNLTNVLAAVSIAAQKRLALAQNTQHTGWNTFERIAVSVSLRW